MEACDVGLVLGLGIGGDHSFSSPCKRREKSPVQFHKLFPTHVNYKADQRDDGENKFVGGNKKDGSSKKLRLTKEQSSLLEESFRRHNTLNPVQKKELAERLHLKARQVEVWFQNRRARTKLKQTEVDCDFLKKCCESLREENRRLKKELQELRLMKLRPLSTTIAICPSCERIASGSGDGGGKSDSETTFDAVPTAIDAKPKLFGYCTKATV